MSKSPKEILSETTPQIRSIIEQVLKNEREYQHFRKLSSTQESDICNRIINLVEKEVKS